MIAAHTSLNISKAPEDWAAGRNVRYAVNTSLKPMSSGHRRRVPPDEHGDGRGIVGDRTALRPRRSFGAVQPAQPSADLLARRRDRAGGAAPADGGGGCDRLSALSRRPRRDEQQRPSELCGGRANWYRKSIDLYNGFAPAIAGLSRTLSMEWLVRGLTDDELLRQALTVAENAVDTDPFDGRGLRERGFSQPLPQAA